MATPLSSSLRAAAAAASSSSSASPFPDDNNSIKNNQKNLLSSLYSSLARSNDALPLAVVAAALLALLRPQAFGFFEPRHYPPALGFLSFSIGLSLDPSSFAAALSRDKGRSFAAGCALQWLIKPSVGLAVAKTVVPLLKLPAAVGTGVVLVSVVSGAQLSNYATFLAAPALAPLSVLLTSASTALGSLLTPVLALLLLRARLPPFDPLAVAASLAQVVVLPIAAGAAAQRAVSPKVIAAAKPALSSLALLDTVSCVGASLASNSELLLGGGRGGSGGGSTTAARILVAVLSFHGLCALAGSALASLVGERRRRDDGPSPPLLLGRAFALQGAMQSSLLALLLAHSCFGGDRMVAATAGVSTAAMTIFGFLLVEFWKLRDGKNVKN